VAVVVCSAFLVLGMGYPPDECCRGRYMQP
jgi:hypothetical protein